MIHPFPPSDVSATEPTPSAPPAVADAFERGSKRPTLAQELALSYLAAQLHLRGIPPSIREMSRAFGWTSTNAASDKLVILERLGLIRVRWGSSRAIAITAAGREALAARRFVFLPVESGRVLEPIEVASW